MPLALEFLEPLSNSKAAKRNKKWVNCLKFNFSSYFYGDQWQIKLYKKQIHIFELKNT